MHVLAIGGSYAGISAALRARELDRDVEITVTAGRPIAGLDRWRAADCVHLLDSMGGTHAIMAGLTERHATESGCRTGS